MSDAVLKLRILEDNAYALDTTIDSTKWKGGYTHCRAVECEISAVCAFVDKNDDNLKATVWLYYNFETKRGNISWYTMQPLQIHVELPDGEKIGFIASTEVPEWNIPLCASVQVAPRRLGEEEADDLTD